MALFQLKVSPRIWGDPHREAPSPENGLVGVRLGMGDTCILQGSAIERLDQEQDMGFLWADLEGGDPQALGPRAWPATTCPLPRCPTSQHSMALPRWPSRRYATAMWYWLMARYLRLQPLP